MPRTRRARRCETPCPSCFPPTPPTQITQPDAIADAIAAFLLDTDGTAASERQQAEHKAEVSAMQSFLSKLDDFDLNDYMRRIHFDKLRVPQSPIKSSGTKHYLGAEGMKRAEIEFIKRTVLSSTTEPVWEYSSLPMEELAQDEGFAKKWMGGLALLLKKGLPLNIIHDLDRPFAEMLLGLESWIPLYMTGLIRSYYLPDDGGSPYSHLVRTSEVCALVGECVNGDLATAHFTLTSDRDRLPAMSQYRDTFFDRARPLIEMYGDDRLAEYEALCAACAEKNEPVITPSADSVFYKNITTRIYGGSCAMIEKENEPGMRFVLRHPKLISALSACQGK